MSEDKLFEALRRTKGAAVEIQYKSGTVVTGFISSITDDPKAMTLTKTEASHGESDQQDVAFGSIQKLTIRPHSGSEEVFE